MAASKKISGPGLQGMGEWAMKRGNISGSAPNKVSLKAIRISGGAASTPSPTRSVTTATQPKAGQIWGGGSKKGMAPYDQTPNPRKPASYKK